jgi:hypothetical protein
VKHLFSHQGASWKNNPTIFLVATKVYKIVRAGKTAWDRVFFLKIRKLASLPGKFQNLKAVEIR